MPDVLKPVVLRVEIDAPPAIVWPFLTEPEHVPRWLGCMRYDNRPGHVFFMQQDAEKRGNDDVEGATHCEILELDEPRLFAFSWYLPGTPKTRVDIELSTRDTGTLVTLTHSGWELFDAGEIRAIYDALRGGWSSYVLPGLKTLVEEKAG